MVAPLIIAPAAKAPTIATTRVFLMEPSPLKSSRPTACFARRSGICCRGLRQSEQGRRQSAITTPCGMLAGRKLDGRQNRQEDAGLGLASPPVPLDARRPAGHLILFRPPRPGLDEAPFLFGVQDP